jgi:hypothetical protein
MVMEMDGRWLPIEINETSSKQCLEFDNKAQNTSH